VSRGLQWLSPSATWVLQRAQDPRFGLARSLAATTGHLGLYFSFLWYLVFQFPGLLAFRRDRIAPAGCPFGIWDHRVFPSPTLSQLTTAFIAFVCQASPLAFALLTQPSVSHKPRRDLLECYNIDALKLCH